MCTDWPLVSMCCPAIPAAGREWASHLHCAPALWPLCQGQLCPEVPPGVALSHPEGEPTEPTAPQVNEPWGCGRAEQPRQSRGQREGEQGKQQEEEEREGRRGRSKDGWGKKQKIGCGSGSERSHAPEEKVGGGTGRGTSRCSLQGSGQ